MGEIWRTPYHSQCLIVFALTLAQIFIIKTRDEQEVAGYAEAMDLVFQSSEDLHLTENHIRQLHQQFLRHSHKDERHRGDYKTLEDCHVF
jgi:hypothetical protein